MSGRRRANKGGLRTIAHAPRVELEASIIEVRDVSDGDLGNQRVQERVVRRERRPQDRLPFGNPLRFLLNEEYLWSQQPCICTRHQHLFAQAASIDHEAEWWGGRGRTGMSNSTAMSTRIK